MKKKAKYIIPVALLGFLGVSSVATLIPTFIALNAEASLKNIEIYDAYSLGDTIKISNKVSIEKDGKFYVIDQTILTLPNGTSTSGSEFQLGLYGKYSIYFKGHAENNVSDTATLEKTFTVNQFYFKTSSSNTQISYGSLNHIFSKNNYSSGLKLKMAAGDTFTYSKPVNIYEKSLNEIIAFNVLQFQPNKVRQTIVRLTDAYDPSIYVDLIQNKKEYDYENYISMSAYGKKTGALIEDSKGIITDGTRHYSVETNFPGTMAAGNLSVNGNYNNMYYTLDTSSKTNIKFYSTTDAVTETLFVSELNNPNIYSYGFNGFTTGDVYISLKVDAFFNTDYADVEIAHIFGVSGEDLKPMDYYYDTNAPIFRSSINEQERKIVAGVPCNVPTVKAMDDTGLRGETTTTIYYNYDSSGRIVIPSNGGKFIPSYLGTYSIIYSATDYYGNVGTYRLDLNAIKKAEEGISIDVTSFGSAYAGDLIKLDNYAINSLAPSSVKVFVKVTKPNGEIEEITDLSKGYRPNSLGVYKIQYIYSDYYYSGSYQFAFNCANKGYGLFEKDAINIQPYFIGGASYSLEQIDAFTFTQDGSSKIKTKAYVSYDGGEYSEINRANFTVKNDANTIKFKYTLADHEDTFIVSEMAKVVSITNYGTVNKEAPLGLTDYFVSEDNSFSAVSDVDYLSYIANRNGNLKLDFVNKLLYSQFNLTFAVPSSVSYDFKLVLTDFNDRNNKFELDFLTQGGSKDYVSINGETPIKLSSSWANGSTIQLLINQSGGNIKVGDDVLATSFTMPNEYCLLSFEFSGVSVGNAFNIARLMGQTLNSNIKRDTTRPLVTADLPEVPAKIGQIITVGSPKVADVLSPNAEETASMRVRFAESSGTYSVMKDLNGVLLDNVTDFSTTHQVEIPTYGSCLIEYFFTDGVGRESELQNGINLQRVICTDDIAPEISINGYDGSPIKVSINTEITPLSVTVSDNFSPVNKISIYYFVYKENGEFVTSCLSGKTFKLTKSGNYVVYAYCEDEAGNANYASYLMKA